MRAFMSGLDERYHRRQFTWDSVNKKFVAHEEIVPDGCLSAELSDFLLNIAEGHRPADAELHHIILGGATMLVIPPAVMIVYALPYFGNPADGLSVANTLSFMVADLMAGVGLCQIILQAMHVQVSELSAALRCLSVSSSFSSSRR